MTETFMIAPAGARPLWVLLPAGLLMAAVICALLLSLYGARGARIAVLPGYGQADRPEQDWGEGAIHLATADYGTKFIIVSGLLTGVVPYPSLNVVVMEGRTPGGHSPPGMVVMSLRPLLFRSALLDVKPFRTGLAVTLEAVHQASEKLDRAAVLGDDGHLGGRHVRHAPLLHASARDDPFVRGLDTLFRQAGGQIVIGHAARRQRLAVQRRLREGFRHQGPGVLELGFRLGPKLGRLAACAKFLFNGQLDQIFEMIRVPLLEERIATAEAAGIDRALILIDPEKASAPARIRAALDLLGPG